MQNSPGLMLKQRRHWSVSFYAAFCRRFRRTE